MSCPSIKKVQKKVYMSELLRWKGFNISRDPVLFVKGMNKLGIYAYTA